MDPAPPVTRDNTLSYSVSDLPTVLIFLKKTYIRLSSVVFHYFLFNVNKADV